MCFSKYLFGGDFSGRCDSHCTVAKALVGLESKASSLDFAELRFGCNFHFRDEQTPCRLQTRCSSFPAR